MEDKIVEILQYTLKTGSGAEFHRIMSEVSVPLHLKHGIDVVAYGNSLHATDSYFLIRAFDNEETMSITLEDFYSSDDWCSGPRKDIISRIELSLKSVLALSQSAVNGLYSK